MGQATSKGLSDHLVPPQQKEQDERVGSMERRPSKGGGSMFGREADVAAAAIDTIMTQCKCMYVATV